MDNDLKLVDVINDPVALDQFLGFPVYEPVESHSLEDIVPVTTEEDLLNVENCDLGYSTGVNGAAEAKEWNFEPSVVSSVGALTADSGLVVSLPQRLPAVSQNLPVGCVSASASHNFIQIQPSRSNINDVKQLFGNAESSIQRFPNASRIMTNFAVASSVDNGSGSAIGSQVLVNVQPQTVVQNGAVRIQYIQVQNQPPGAVPTGTVVQNIGAIQLPTNSLKQQHPQQQQSQQLLAHGVQGGMNLQGSIIPTSAGNHIMIRTVNQASSNVNAGQMNMQPMQIGSSNFVAGTQVTSAQQGARLQQPQVTTFVSRTNAVTGQVIDTGAGLAGGRHIVLHRTPGVASQNLVVQQVPQQQQQQAVTLPVDATGSQDNKHSDSLVVQIGGQTYRLEPSHQPLGGANVRQNSIFPQSQNVGFGDGSGVGVSQDPVKMLKQNVQLQQMLIGNQINVLQMLQKQQQQQQQCLQPMFTVQQFGAGNSGTNSTEVTSGSSGTILHQTVDVSQPLQAPNTLEKTSFDPSLWGLRPSGAIASASQSGLQFIQPKPVASVGIPSSSCIVSQPLNVLPLVQLGTQPTVSSANRNVVGVNVQSSAQVITTLSGSQLNLKPVTPQSVKGVAGGQPQTVTTVKLSAEQQTLLVKIQSQMKTLLSLPVRNPDQEKYLQMLVSGQQRIIGQGVSQYLQQQKTTAVKVVSSGSLQQQQQNAQPTASVVQFIPSNSVANTSTATTSVPSTNSTSTSLTSSMQNTGQIKAEDIFQTMPHLKEKIEAHMSKMSPEQRQWFDKNQSSVFAKLQQHHRRLLLDRDKIEQLPEQLLKPLIPVQLKNSSEVNSSSEAAATRVIRSLHLTRAQKFHLYLQKDQKRATQPEHSKAFGNFKDVIRGLVPYHIFQARDPSDEEIATVEETFEEKARELVERKDGMLRKYRQLLMEESMRPQLTSEMVLLERTFHSDEKALLMNEKRQAEEDPDSFVPKPVLKWMKLEDGDVKKEDCKDENMADGEEVMESAASLDENVVKLESRRSCPSSPTNTRLLSASTSFERHGGLRIKLEKLEDLYDGLTETKYKISKFDSPPPRDEENSRGESNRQDGSKISQIPTTTSGSCEEGFTEDDMAVASLLNTESFNITGCNFDGRSAAKVVNTNTGASEDCAAVSGTLTANSTDAYFNNSLFTSVADMDAGEISSERENCDLMQGTIDSLVADLTQFNYDLNSSWSANVTKADDSGLRPTTTVQNAQVKHDSSAAGGSECTLQYEMQCAIDSIVQLQQPWSDGVGTTMSDLLRSSTVEMDSSSLQNRCFDKY